MSEDTKAKNENIHAGHRQRMLEIFMKNGISGFSDVEVLEFLLSYALPRVDTNSVAHRLLNEFGSLHQVFDAPTELLVRVKGVGVRAASLIRFVASLWNRTEESRLKSERYFRTTQDIGRFLVSQIGYYREERSFLMSLDNCCKLLDFRELSRGSVSFVNLPFRSVLQTAMLVNASTVVLAHNHIGENCLPSPEDISYTKTLYDTLNKFDIVLADHFIVTVRTYLSMKSSQMLGF